VFIIEAHTLLNFGINKLGFKTDRVRRSKTQAAPQLPILFTVIDTAMSNSFAT